MDDDEEGGRQLGRQLLDELDQGREGAGGAADDDNVTPGHGDSIPGQGSHAVLAPFGRATGVGRGDRLRLVLGSPGATRIITSNLQVILNVLDFGMNLTDAVLAPRFHCQGDIIRCQARIPEYACTE